MEPITMTTDELTRLVGVAYALGCWHNWEIAREELDDVNCRRVVEGIEWWEQLWGEKVAASDLLAEAQAWREEVMR